MNGVFDDCIPGVLSTDFFANLLDMRYEGNRPTQNLMSCSSVDRLDRRGNTRRPAPIWCLVPTPYCARWRKFTRSAMRNEKFVKDRRGM